MTFEPLKDHEGFYIERLCKCRCEQHAKRRDKCKIWKPLPNRTKADLRASSAAMQYFQRHAPEIFRTGTIELDYAFYRIRRVE